MSLDTDEVETLDLEQEVYVIDLDDVSNPQQVTGVAKRKFREDHDLKKCRAKKQFDYNGFYVVVVTEDLFRDHWDGCVIKAIRRNPEVVEDYKNDVTGALRILVDEAKGHSYDWNDTPDDMPDRVERLVERLE